MFAACFNLVLKSLFDCTQLKTYTLHCRVLYASELWCSIPRSRCKMSTLWWVTYSSVRRRRFIVMYSCGYLGKKNIYPELLTQTSLLLLTHWNLLVFNWLSFLILVRIWIRLFNSWSNFCLPVNWFHFWCDTRQRNNTRGSCGQNDFVSWTMNDIRSGIQR